VKKGVLSAIGAYLTWGLLPIYLKSLHEVPAVQIVFHRIVWSFLFLVVIMLARKEWKKLVVSVFSFRVLLIYVLTAFLLAANWMMYVWGVNAGHVVETSLGYYINPLFSVILGVVLLKEKLRAWQWVPVGMATAGVLYLTLYHGRLPWIALVLALTFSLYGLFKKIAPLNSLYGLTIETTVLFLPAFASLLYFNTQGSGAFGHTGWLVAVLLPLSGIITSVPLLLYSTAARSIPLSLLGILQYLSPTMQLILGLLLFREPFTWEQVFGYSIIWAALIILTIEGWTNWRKNQALNTASNLAPETVKKPV